MEEMRNLILIILIGFVFISCTRITETVTCRNKQQVKNYIEKCSHNNKIRVCKQKAYDLYCTSIRKIGNNGFYNYRQIIKYPEDEKSNNKYKIRELQ